MLRKINNTWYYQTKVNGKTWRRTTGETNRRKAETKVPKLKRLVRLHRNSPENSLNLDSAILAEVTRVELDTSAREAERVGQALRNFRNWIGETSLDRIDGKTLEIYQRKRLQEAAKSTVDKEIVYAVRLLRGNGFDIHRPKSRPGRTTPNRAFTEEELSRFFDACPVEHKTLFLFLLATGARPAEVIPSPRSDHVALLKKEIDEDGSRVTIRTAKQGRGQQGPVRIIPLPGELLDLVQEEAESTPGPHVFVALESLAKAFNAVLKSAEIEKIDPLGHRLVAHSFRHTYATRMAETVGNNPFILKQILGHSQISTTEQYCHNTAPAVVIDISKYIRGGTENERGAITGCHQEESAEDSGT